MAALNPVCAAIEPKCASRQATMGCCCCCEPRTGVLINGVLFILWGIYSFLGDLTTISKHFGIPDEAEWMKDTAKPDGWTMLYQSSEVLIGIAGTACRVVVVLRVYNGDVKGLRTAWRWLAALFVLERFIIDVLKPLFHQPHACEEMHAFDMQACSAASTNMTCTAVPQANPAMKAMGNNIPRCIWLGGACEPADRGSTGGCQIGGDIIYWLAAIPVYAWTIHWLWVVNSVMLSFDAGRGASITQAELDRQQAELDSFSPP